MQEAAAARHAAEQAASGPSSQSAAPHKPPAATTPPGGGPEAKTPATSKAPPAAAPNAPSPAGGAADVPLPGACEPTAPTHLQAPPEVRRGRKPKASGVNRTGSTHSHGPSARQPSGGVCHPHMPQYSASHPHQPTAASTRSNSRGSAGRSVGCDGGLSQRSRSGSALRPDAGAPILPMPSVCGPAVRRRGEREPQQSPCTRSLSKDALDRAQQATLLAHNERPQEREAEKVDCALLLVPGLGNRAFN